MKYLDYGFAGKTAIVTGGGTGMGRSIAVELSKGGAKVAVFGRRIEPLLAVKAECEAQGAEALAIACDVSDGAQVKAAVKEVTAAFGGVDILINCAGIEVDIIPGTQPIDTHFDTMDEDEYIKFYRVHAQGHYLMCNAVIPYMTEKNFGRIVNITSVTGITGEYGCPAYTASKAAANLQTKAYALKYGKSNITVNAIAPGMVNTPMKSASPPEEFDYVAGITPLGRVAEPIDIARVALFFAQENLFVTGQVLIADGGCHM